MSLLINIYSIEINQYFDNVQELYNLLSTAEQKQSRRFISNILSNKYIITRASLKILLSQYLNISINDISFIRNTYGKPSLKNSDVTFNMSHSLNMVYYAISRRLNIGIDVEFFDKVKDISNIAKSVFSAREFDVFSNLPDFKKNKFFFKAWTQKEAIIKAMGLGLYFPMEDIDTTVLLNQNYIEQDETRYYVFLLDSNNDYLAHLAVQDESNVCIKQYKELNLFKYNI